MAKHVGSKFTDFLADEGIQEDVDLLTVKKVFVEEIRARMHRMKLTVAELARRMKTSRPAVNKLLDAEDTGVTLKTLAKAATATNWSLIDLLITVDRKKQLEKRKR